MVLKSELSKSDKLMQRLKASQKFATDRISQDTAYSEILKTLNYLEGTLKSGKLPVQIVSQDKILAQTLQALLKDHLPLKETYQFIIGVLPELSNLGMPPTSPNLTLITIVAGDEQQTRYELVTLENQAIGRHPNSQIRLPNDSNLVSGHHAELKPVAESEDAGYTQWQLCDRNSTNGTYVNGDRLRGCQILQNGDRISLGSPCLNAKSAVLAFECQTPVAPPSFETDADYRQLFGGAIVCLVIDPTQPLSTADKYFVAQASQATISKLLVIAALPGGSISESIQATLADLQTWINNQPHQTVLEVIPLLLSPFTAKPGATVLMPHAQINFERLCQALETAVQGNSADALIHYVATCFESQMRAIETVLHTQEALLMQHTEQEEQSKELPSSSLKEQSRRLLAKINSEKDLFFRQIKTDINQSKAKLLDDLRQSSLPHKVREFLEELEFVETRQKGYCYIRLKVGNALETDADISVVHLAAMQLINTELKQWTIGEWKRIHNTYSEGGIKRLSEKSDQALSAIPHLTLPGSLLYHAHQLTIEPILQTSVVQPFCETRYKHTTIGGYLVKNIRMQAMQWVGLFTMVATSLMLLAPGLHAGSQDLRGYILLAVLPITAPCLFFSYRHEQKEKSQEAVERLRKDLLSHYQSIVKSLADKLVQHLITLIDVEERQFRDALEAINDQYQNQIGELEKNQLQLKAQLEESKRIQQKNVANLSKDLAEFQKLQLEPVLSSR
jgi:hypothetical protein